MKIIQITASYKPAFVYGGPTMSVSKLSEELCKSGFQVEVLTTLANGKTELYFPSGEKTMIENVPVRFFKRLTKDHSHFSPALLKHLLQIKKTDEPLIVHIHAWWNLVSVCACLIAQLRKIPVVLSPRGTLSSYSFNHKKSSFKKLMHFLAGKNLLQKCYFHVTSEQEKQEIRQLIQPKNICVIPNFVSLPEYPQQLSADKNSVLKLLFFSRIETKKGLEILLEALHQIEIPYQLTIAGSGEASYIDALKKIVAKNSMEKFVNWIGFQPDETKFKVMQTHDLLVLPSYNENFANVVVESLAVGTAVLISNKVGLADYVNKTNLGKTFINQPENLRQQLLKIDRNRQWLEDVRVKAPLQIRQDFAAKQLVKQYGDFYQEILND